MNCWLVIPVKPPGKAKTRLAEVLDESQRTGLAKAMLRQVLAAAQNADGVAQVALIGPERMGAPDSIPLIADPGGGLNRAAEAALHHAEAHGADRLIILFADLPKLTSAEVARLAQVPPQSIALATDRHGTGTNALSLPIPAARGFTFAFGTDSFAEHKAEAGRLGLRIEELREPGLACDIDMPDDLADAEGLIDPAP